MPSPMSSLCSRMGGHGPNSWAERPAEERTPPASRPRPGGSWTRATSLDLTSFGGSTLSVRAWATGEARGAGRLKGSAAPAVWSGSLVSAKSRFFPLAFSEPMLTLRPSQGMWTGPKFFPWAP